MLLISLHQVIDWQQTKDGLGYNDKGIEKANIRFQNNLRWMSGVRDCVKWIQEKEQENRYFYDIIVRLREDTLAFGPWIFDTNTLKGALTSADLGSYRGINDHNLVLDRKYADVLFRGMVEDYYFLKSNNNMIWNNTEHRIYMLATEYDIPIQTLTLCDMPLIPLRANQNSTHWLLHPAYTEKYLNACIDKVEKERNCLCDGNQDWLNFFRSGVSPFNWPKLPRPLTT